MKKRFIPCGPRFIARIENEEQKTSGGLWKPVEYMDKRQQKGDTCRIISIGEDAWKDRGDGKPWAKVGDLVATVQWSGAACDSFEDDKMRIFNDDDLLYVIEEYEDESEAE